MTEEKKMKYSDSTILRDMLGSKEKLLVWEYILEWAGEYEITIDDFINALDEELHVADIKRAVHWFDENNILEWKNGKYVIAKNELNAVGDKFFSALVNHKWFDSDK